MPTEVQEVRAAARRHPGLGTGDSEALRPKGQERQLPSCRRRTAEVLTDPKQSPYNFVVRADLLGQMRIRSTGSPRATRAHRFAVFQP